MKRQSLVFLPLALFLAGCASGGSAGEEQPAVPVYGPDEETPCEYEFLATVTAELSPLTSGRMLEEEMIKELGKAGAKSGADAVILPAGPGGGLRLPFTVERVGGSRNSSMPTQGPEVEGQAVRWIQETCKG